MFCIYTVCRAQVCVRGNGRATALPRSESIPLLIPGGARGSQKGTGSLDSGARDKSPLNRVHVILLGFPLAVSCVTCGLSASVRPTI